MFWIILRFIFARFFQPVLSLPAAAERLLSAPQHEELYQNYSAKLEPFTFVPLQLSTCSLWSPLTLWQGTSALAHLWTGDPSQMDEAAPKGVHALSFASLAHKSFIKDVSFAYTEGRKAPLRTGQEIQIQKAPACLCVGLAEDSGAAFCVCVALCATVSVLIHYVLPFKCAYHV